MAPAHQCRTRTGISIWGASGQGISAGVLAERCQKTLLLTGTLAGGYASTLFYLLFRFNPKFRSRYKINEVESFVQKYGLLEKITYETEDEDGKKSSRKKEKFRLKEKPGISPLVLAEFLENTAFLRLADLGIDLVKPEVVVRAPIHGQSANSQPDKSHLRHN